MAKHSSSKVSGYLSIVLHAHLPYIRCPEHEHYLEERWLYEAVTETYIPLIDMLENLLSDDVDFRLTLSLTPTLIEMLHDELLMNRYERYLDDLLDLSEKEVSRTRNDLAFGPLARMYRKRLINVRRLFREVYRKNLVSALRSLSNSHNIEIVASAATHAYLPALMTTPAAANAQIKIGLAHYRKTFGGEPEGMWLPECGFVPGLDGMIGESGAKYFFLESHGLLNAVPQCKYSVYAPVRTPAGVIAFSRDVESSKQVWSSMEGYPGDFDYRDFYRDIGFDMDYGYLGTFLPGGIRTFTGFKYYRITNKSGDKKPYIPGRALEKARVHADHFIAAKNIQARLLREKLRIQPVITAAYDAELFGHWWFEGLAWLNFFLRRGSQKKNSFRFVTPSEYLSENRCLETAMPSASSWGDRGYNSTWINPSNHWIYRHLNRAARLLGEMSSQHRNARGILKKALNQASRELLLAQASDWAFMMKTGNAFEFAGRKFREHLNNFLILHGQIATGRIHTPTLLGLELKNNIFKDIDFRVYGNTDISLSETTL